MTKNELHIGPGGVPLSTKQVKDPETGKKLDLRHSAIYRLEELELNHMEVEFVHGVRIKEKDARSLGELAKEHDISLTMHGSYYINLASNEKPKYHASINRVIKALTAAHWIGSSSVTFHPAYYQGRTPEETTALVKEAIQTVYENEKLMKLTGGDFALLSLETTGKGSQWGSLEEIISLAKELNDQYGVRRISACVDFAHLHARSNGGWNSYDEFMKLLDMVRDGLGDNDLKTLHMHMSGINYSEKGERNHLNLEESDMKWQELLKALKDQEVGGWLTCETPNLEDDSILMRDYYNSL